MIIRTTDDLIGLLYSYTWEFTKDGQRIPVTVDFMAESISAWEWSMLLTFDGRTTVLSLNDLEPVLTRKTDWGDYVRRLLEAAAIALKADTATILADRWITVASYGEQE
ncbi:hypothetical protein [Bifidobacterium felsineum]|uniref:hypothetical protein n=1 Tax=Bifidobacterium felsineum TaxID=2045440 RepID=UPI001BDC7ACC|nr:hypothetical protein [Bifidobacterium felsineum]MBT1164599.1 hypothetical protein [Bifidobacterium felsineum]